MIKAFHLSLLSLLLFQLLQANPGVSAKPDAEWVYKKVDDKKLNLSVFLPEGYEESEELFPTIVIYHGGSWRTGTPSMHFADCAYWSERGMIAVSVDYRLKDRDGVEVPLECVKDAKSAIRFLRKNADELKVDSNKIIAAGGSAGGQLAAATAMLIAAETNDDCYDLSISCKPQAIILYNPYFRCAAELSPPNFVVEDLPPIITFLGDADPAITVGSLLKFHEALKAKSNVSEYYVGKGGKHGFCNGRNPRNPFFYWSLELADAFLVQNSLLKGESIIVIPDRVERVSEGGYITHK